MNKLAKYCKNNFFSKEVHYDFLVLFTLKEGKELLGKNFKNFWVLSGILFLTFLTIGFANGSLDYLEKKMSDPFVNWVSVAVPHGRADEIPEVKNQLLLEDIKSNYNVKTVSGFYGLITRFSTYGKTNTYFANGRSIANNSPLISQVLGKRNLIKGSIGFQKNSVGLIVTEELLDKLNYDENNPFVYMALAVNADSTIEVPLPIISIVHELPGLYDFAFTPYFFEQRRVSSGKNPFRVDQYNNGRLNFFISSEKLTEIEADSLIRSVTNDKFSDLFPLLSIKQDTTKIDKGISAEIMFSPKPDIKELTRIFNEIKNSSFFNSYELYREYPFKLEYAPDKEEYHYLSIHFSELNKIRKFRNYLVERFDLDIDMSLIESKENYSFVSRLTRILSVILLIFSVLSLTLYSTNVFIRHIEKIKMNLGTFKAFGLDNKLLKRIYLSLIFAFVFGGIIISLIITAILGKIGLINFLLTIFNYTVDQNYNLFSLQSIWTLIVIVIILLTLMTVLIIVTNKLLRKSPGDLIYDR